MLFNFTSLPPTGCRAVGALVIGRSELVGLARLVGEGRVVDARLGIVAGADVVQLYFLAADRLQGGGRVGDREIGTRRSCPARGGGSGRRRSSWHSCRRRCCSTSLPCRRPVAGRWSRW